ncbi:MAG: lytic transglycosylase domain-containing protein, partial [Muribaculaceae bacterium]|nr:lytic transglycosylase domain-containing protein [Muribaculaceae bacterium]
MNRTRITTLLVAALATLAMMAAQKNSILSIKQTITDDNIVFPESFETDTHELMTNWYLQNYTILDADVEKRSTGEVSEQEYIKRLAALPTEIEMPYNQVVRSYIDRYVKRNRTLVEEMLGMSLYYMPIFEQALEQEQLPLELKYLPVIESALNPNAVSRAGAAGLWQFMVGTGKGLGLEVNSLVDERRDPYRSSTMAATYLKNLFSIYNDWSLAIAAYNCGPGNVNKALRRAGGEGADFWAIYPYLPRETRGYVPAFIAANYVMTYFKQHNIS